METYDYVRLDHLIGFSSYYKIAKGKPAREGILLVWAGP